MGIPLRIAEPAGRYRRSLRRYSTGGMDVCPLSGYHNASRDIGEIGDAEHIKVSGDDWPHDDPRWPETCACGYTFAEADHWQRNDCMIYRLPDGTEFINWGSLTGVPPGTMIRIPWYRPAEGGESWLVILPDGGQWITTQAATGGGYWTVTGTPPHITVSPSIWHNAPNGWHGFIRAGELVDA